MGTRRCYGLIALATLVMGCGSKAAGPPAATTSASRSAPIPTTSTLAATSSTSAPTPPPAETFSASVALLSDADRAVMTGVSWHPGCPVGLDALRMVTLTFVDRSGAVHHDGRIVVRDRAADAVVTVFRALFETGYPIERMEPVDAFGGDDEASMAADNTSGFNCRPVTGGTTWSRHAYGEAVDVNPLYNPWVKGDRVEPANGRRWRDRASDDPRVIHRGDAVVRAFAAVGWGWGGDFRDRKDWQHFSADGR